MHFFKENMMKDLETFYAAFLPEIKRLRKKISMDSVYQQEYQMRCKRQLQELESFVPSFQAQI